MTALWLTTTVFIFPEMKFRTTSLRTFELGFNYLWSHILLALDTGVENSVNTSKDERIRFIDAHQVRSQWHELWPTTWVFHLIHLKDTQLFVANSVVLINLHHRRFIVSRIKNVVQAYHLLDWFVPGLAYKSIFPQLESYLSIFWCRKKISSRTLAWKPIRHWTQSSFLSECLWWNSTHLIRF